MSSKLLLKLEAIGYMLSHHTSTFYSFLDHPVNTRNRTMYYSTLARLLFLEDTPHKFQQFVAPLQQVITCHMGSCSRQECVVHGSLPMQTSP